MGGGGVHLTSVHLTTYLCDQNSHMHGHKMSLPGEGQFDILFDRESVSQTASLPAAIVQPTSHVTKYKLIRLGVGQIFCGREGQVDILFDRQSASQPACQLKLVS